MSVRARLTLLYSALFALSGFGLLVLTYLLTQTGRHSYAASDPTRRAAYEMALHTVLRRGLVATAAMTAVSMLLGWIMAGRVLRPVRTITAATQQISARNLHQRLALTGPADELKTLGDTIDGLLTRLDTAFAAQRRFVANASHELRTPLARQLTLLEVALADQDPTALHAACQEALQAGREQERLIEALFTLAQSEGGMLRHEPVDLQAITDEITLTRTQQAAERQITITTDLRPLTTNGSPELLERLVANLVDNALRHNHPGGHIAINTQNHTLTITNTGPTIPSREIPRLLQPFQRLTTDRTTNTDSLGLGLSIVAAIATAHNAELTVQPTPHPAGGLRIKVAFSQSGPQ